MIELFAGVAGGLGLFIVGMWLLTENLKTLASRRLRRAASRWTEDRFSALLWGTVAGAVAQSMSAMTFIVVSILRSGLITPQGALALILGGSIGVSTLVIVVTFDIKLVAFYVLGITSMVVVSERLARYRAVAASFLGGAMIITGLVLLKEAAAPLSEEPWFRDMLESSGDSLALAFLVAALLTALVQSSGAITVFGISLATVGVISVDQAIMTMYGGCLGSGAIIYLLSASLSGRSRQVAMYMVWYNVLICAVLVPLLYCELYFDIPLVKALVLSARLEQDQQLALLYVFLCVFLTPLMLTSLGWSARLLERVWPTSHVDELSQPKFIHDRALVDVDSSLVLADLEQKRLVKNLSHYFDTVRHGEPVRPVRDACRHLLGDISGFLDDLQNAHPMQQVEGRNSMRNRQKLLIWLEEALGAMCETLSGLDEASALAQFRTSICESVDGVLLALVDAMASDTEMEWDMARALTGDRSEMMRKLRMQHLEITPPLRKVELINVLLITNTVEETFFLLSKMESEFNPASEFEAHVPHA